METKKIKEKYFPSFLKLLKIIKTKPLLFFGLAFYFTLTFFFIVQPFFLVVTPHRNYEILVKMSEECHKRNSKCTSGNFCMIQCPDDGFYRSMQERKGSFLERGLPIPFVTYHEPAGYDPDDLSKGEYTYSIQWSTFIIDLIIFFTLPLSLFRKFVKKSLI